MPPAPPTPSARPNEIGLEKIFLFPEKWAVLRAEPPDLSYPVSVELSLTNRCNLACRWCSDLALRRRPDRLDLDVLRRLFDDLAAGGARGATIEGGGEPTISPLFEPAVDAALAAGLAAGLITNGVELLTPRRGPEFFGRFEWIRVSLDAADPETYRRLKGRDAFGSVLAQLERLAAEPARPTLGVGYVLTGQNDEPTALVKLAETLKNLGVDYLHVRPVVDHPEMLSRADLGALPGAAAAGFAVNLDALSDNRGQGNDGLPCLAHSLSAVVTADAEVWLCGRLNANPDADSLGNLTAQSFREIWTGPRRRQQARRAADAAFCRSSCPQCRLTKYNRLLDRLSRLRTVNFI
jgi:radical SAM protein with 4Fe4S-binding SPASM domain